MLGERGIGRGRGRGRAGPQVVPDLPQLGVPETAQSLSRGRGRSKRSSTPPPEQQLQQLTISPPVAVPERIGDDFSISPPKETTRPITSSPKRPQPANLSDLESIGLKVNYKHAVEPELPRRPDRGTLGRRIRLYANWFRINIPSGNFYHYDVEVTRARVGNATDPRLSSSPGDEKKYRCLNTQRNRLIISTLFSTAPELSQYCPAYDGEKNIYTRDPMLEAPFTKTVTLDGQQEPDKQSPSHGRRTPDRRQGDVYKITVKPVHKKGGCGEITGGNKLSCAINLDSIHMFFEGKTSTIPRESLAAVETVLRCTPCLNLTPIGRSFFSAPSDENRCLIGGKQEIWFGYHQSLRIGEWPAINIDISATAFYERAPVLDYVTTILKLKRADLDRKPQLDDHEVIRLSKDLRGLRVRTNYLKGPQRKYRIFRVTKEPANRLTFNMTSADGVEETVSVSGYFQRQYGFRLRYGHFPCLQVQPESRKRYLPLEACEICEGQPYKKMLSDEQKREMIKFTSVAPSDRFQRIAEIVRDAKFDTNPCCRAFGLTIDTRPVQLEGRVLEPPGVCFNNRQMVMPRDGQWDMRSKQFVRPAVIEKWVLISFANDCSFADLKNFARDLVSTAVGLGIQIGEPAEIKPMEGNHYRVENVLSLAKRVHGGDCMAVIVIPKSSKTVYPEVKQIAETTLGLATQCVKSDKIASRKPSMLSNLCLKINAKFGGVNSTLNPTQKPAIFSKPVIVIGADVTHYGHSDRQKPSLAAVVGSLDSHPARYSVTCRIQNCVDENMRPVEIIEDLKSMVVEVLKAFYKNTRGKKPEKILFYRDGVSEGQFAQISEVEIRSVRDACKSLGTDYEPGITYVVVQKGHHTRFKPVDNRDGLGRTRNVPPGTTVDTTVVHPTWFDFFLCSQFGLQGTSRPAHYTVLADDNGFTSDEIQKLTYYLCYTYTRCTKSVSAPAPVMYAHLAAFRARQHLTEASDDGGSCSANDDSFSSTISQGMIEKINVIDDLKNSMYFV